MQAIFIYSVPNSFNSAITPIYNPTFNIKILTYQNGHSKY